MSEDKTEDKTGDVKFEQTPATSSGERFTDTMEQAAAKVAAAKATANLPEELQGMDAASLEKYYKEGVFNWEAYGKEQAFKAKQAANKADSDAENKDETSAKDAEKKDGEAAKEAAKLSEDQQKAIKDVANKAGVDWQAAAQSIVDSGKLSDDDRKKLLDVGIPEVVIDDYARLIHKEAGEQIAKVIDSMGGETNFDKVFDGLQANATEDQRNHVDSLLRDPATFDAGIQLAVNLSKVDVKTKPGQTVVTTNRAAPSQDSVVAFKNFQEQMTAQRDPKYKTDPEYRAQVMKRIAASEYSINPRGHTSGL
jgi:hypothetical protein